MTLAAKAARGAGAPPAQAASFGQAAQCHLIEGRDVEVLFDALAALPAGPILDLPLFFVQCIEAAEDGVFDTVLDNNALFLSYLAAQPFASKAQLQGDGRLRIELRLNKPNPRTPVARVELPDDLANHLQTLAARILVPESDASRLSGAGAGLTDND